MIIEPARLYAEPEHLPARSYIDAEQYGVSFSLKQCRNFGLDPHATLDWLIAQGWRRFRLMSYWDLHEPSPGFYNFDELDWQLETIARVGGTVTMAVGVKQPRWPEYHWPNWAWQLPKAERDQALLQYLEQIIEHCKGNLVIESWQLENEALLQGFGERIDIDRRRLQAEFDLLKRLDSVRPILMSTSNGWGMPLRRPVPNVVGFSFYPIMFQKGKYRRTTQKPWLHRLRTHFIHVLLGKPVFIHELQCEPWGPRSIWNMDGVEQDKSMSNAQLAKNIAQAKRIGNYPIYLWGAEWWYWRSLKGNETIYEVVYKALHA